jgi:hypothetical protein
MDKLRCSVPASFSAGTLTIWAYAQFHDSAAASPAAISKIRSRRGF